MKMIGTATLIGFLVAAVIVGSGGFLLWSGFTGKSPSILKTLGISTTSGIVGGFVSIFTDTQAWLSACITGHLGIVGWLAIIMIAFFVGVLFFNGFRDYKKNRPIRLVH
jgi:hypothetical protein